MLSQTGSPDVVQSPGQYTAEKGEIRLPQMTNIIVMQRSFKILFFLIEPSPSITAGLCSVQQFGVLVVGTGGGAAGSLVVTPSSQCRADKESDQMAATASTSTSVNWSRWAIWAASTDRLPPV